MVDLSGIRKEIIAAVASDPGLREQLILKGGNALALVHGVGMRASLDIDYSMSDDLDNPDEFASMLLRALEGRFSQSGITVFDFDFQRRPRQTLANRTWGGYNATFKLVESSAVSTDVRKMRNDALTVSGHPQASRAFRIEISKFEFCDDQDQVAVDDDTVCRVYTRDLVAAEKLRALCQQMTEYGQRRHPTPRARDFYDIHALLTEGGVDFGHPDLHALVAATFDQKHVPLRLIGILADYCDFHEEDWPQVLNAIPARKPREFGYYADFVVAETRKLEPLWDVDLP